MTLSRHPGSSPVLARFCPVSPTRDSSFRSMRPPTFSRRRSPRPRPPFTRPCRSFSGSVCRAYSRPDVAYRLLQLALRRAGNQTRALRSSQGRRPRPSSFSYASRFFLAEAVMRGEPRSARSLRPRCRFFPLAWVCPTAMSTRTRHLLRLSSGKCSGDRRARVLGPSEGRVIPERKRRFFVLATGACAFDCACRRRSPPRRPRDTRCHRCVCR